MFSPINYIKRDKKIEDMLEKNKGVKNAKITRAQLDDRGIHIDKNNNSIMDTNKFINYALTRVVAKENEEGIWFYNLREKHYDLLSERKYKKIFFHIVEEASDSIWKDSMQRKYLEYFKNKVSGFKTDGNTAGVLQFNNCIVDFSGEEVVVSPPSAKHFCNFRLPYNYDENAKCQKFMDFLRDIFEKDQERIDLVQEIMGACLFYEKCMQNLVVFLGNGANGKSVLASTIKHMLGDNNVSAISLDRLSGDRFSKQNLDKKLLNISSETKSGKIYSTADLKTLTGGDSTEVEKKFKDAYTTEIYCKYILLANEMIQTEDHSDGFYRRLIIIPFNRHYCDAVPGEEPDENKLYKDPFLEGNLMLELPGIFNFALDGLLRLWANDFQFTFSSACDKAKKKYMNEHNVVKYFMSECIDIVGVGNKQKIQSPMIYPAFVKFCRENGFYQKLTKPKFFGLFNQIIEDENLDVMKKKGHNDYFYDGMTFKK